MAKAKAKKARKKIEVYLSGPMSGYADYNYPTFHKYEAKLRKSGYSVFSPARADIESGRDKIKPFPLRNALLDDTTYICLYADAIAMMPGWEHSKGAQAEWALARALSLKIIYL